VNLGGKKIDLALLQTELAAAGIVVPALGTAGDDLHTYDVSGAVVDVPAGVAAVLSAHDPEQAPERVLRAQILVLAASAVGVRLDALTAAQQQAILAIIAWKAGAVAADLTVRPLIEWA